MRRMLLALFLACSGVVLTQLPAHACRCLVNDTATDARNAEVVFAGTVSAIEKGREANRFTVAVDRLYKGTVEPEVVVTSAPTESACGLRDMVARQRYIFFGKVQGTTVEANSCGGTARATEQFTETVEKTLGVGRVPADTEPEELSGTLVADTEPASFARLAAPGGALAIVGLLGLLLLRRLGH